MTTERGSLPPELYPWQQEQWLQVNLMMEQKRLPHALIIGGVPGLGKLIFAKRLAATLLCQQTIRGDACGQCKSCQLLASSSHPDFKLMQPDETGKAILVDQVRKIQSAMATTAQQGGARVVIINGATDLNLNAANALLKQLEEPGDNSFFLLLHQWPTHILPTVRSRCQLLDINKPTQEVALAWLQERLANTMAQEGLDTAVKLLQMAKGGPLKALELYETKAHEQRHQVLVQLTAILRGKQTSVEVAQNWHKLPLEQVFTWWIEWLNDLVKLKMTGDAAQLSNLDIIKLLQAVAQRSDIEDIYHLLEKVTVQLNYINQRRNLNPQLVCEELLNSWYLLVKSGRSQ
ncbi:MAG: DNA polymerase III subunit delta' [Gammaproteobacteria bacterium]|nr:DNA polymerase III subunit delta' [Gammaproteobacteria bacterium]